MPIIGRRLSPLGCAQPAHIIHNLLVTDGTGAFESLVAAQVGVVTLNEIIGANRTVLLGRVHNPLRPLMGLVGLMLAVFGLATYRKTAP